MIPCQECPSPSLVPSDGVLPGVQICFRKSQMQLRPPTLASSAFPPGPQFWGNAFKWACGAFSKTVLGGKKKGPESSQAHLSRVNCLSLGSSIFLSMCLVTLRRSFCRSLAFLYFSLNLSAASGVRTHCSPSQYACDLGLPIGRTGTRSPAP